MAEKIKLELDYTDMVMVEWALEDFRKEATTHITALQNKDGPKNPERATLIKIYENRARHAKRIMHLVGAELNKEHTREQSE